MATFEVWRAHFLSWSSSPSILSWNLAHNRHVRRTLCLTLCLFIQYSLIPKVIIETSVCRTVVVYALWKEMFRHQSSCLRCVLVPSRFQLCPTLCDLMDCSLPGSSVYGILQATVSIA